MSDSPVPGAAHPDAGAEQAPASGSGPGDEGAHARAQDPAARHAGPPAPPLVPAVEEAERLLDRVAELPVAERVAVLDAVHRRLQDALAAVDEA